MAWFLLVTAGFAGLWKYKSTPGAPGAATPAQWPSQATVARSAQRATLLVFAHPRCACTRATVTELARLLSRLHERVDATVLFWTPHDAPADWDRTDLWTSASRIPGVTVLRDLDGREASRFAVATSGGAVLYDASGRLLFKGGITSARGHEGDSFGQERIAALLTTGTADRADAPVFGCALEDEPPARLARAGKNPGGDK